MFMRKLSLMSLCYALIGMLLTSNIVWAEQDVEGSKDHPLLSRMANFYISEYEEFDYDAHEFYDEQDNAYNIEGHKWVISYTLNEEFTPPGQEKVRQNFINAIKKIGGVILFARGVDMKVVKGDKETWISLWVSSDGSDYRLTIVEKTALKQEVVADANAMLKDINQSGRVAVYGIYFDFDKAEVKPASDPTLQEIAKLLKQNTKLKLYVVGHTDNVGDFNYNIKLSQARAEAVVNVLAAKYGVAVNRLKPYGMGPLAPITSNKTEDGRAKNRRVELVEQ